MTFPFSRLAAAGLLLGCALPGGRPAAASQEKSRPPAQAEQASKSARFGAVKKSAAAYQEALDAHDLTAGGKLVGKTGAFRGTVVKVFEGQKGDILILNFDADYKKALTAVLKKPEFGRFPEMKQLLGQEVLVSGPFIEYQGRPEIVLTDAAQIRVVR